MLNTIESAIEDIKNGKLIIVVDDEDRENEGDFLTAARNVTPFKKVSLYCFLPFAIQRSRTQSVPDKIRTNITGVYAQGDAAFADYAINIGATLNF